MPGHRASLRPLILVPALITLAVTLLRLTGELREWSPKLFARSAGGGAALVGIVWLVPVFGIYFALRLALAGDGPPSVARALGRAALAFLVNTAVFVGSIMLFPKAVLLQLALFGLGSLVAIAIARPGWPALWRVLLAYGVAARVPVLILMFLAIFLGWDSHYAKPRPDFPPMGHVGLFLWTALLPQATIWIYVTIVGGMLFGAAAVGIRRQAVGTRAAALSGAAGGD